MRAPTPSNPNQPAARCRSLPLALPSMCAATAATLEDARLWDLAVFHLSQQGDPKAAEARAYADALRASVLPLLPCRET